MGPSQGKDELYVLTGYLDSAPAIYEADPDSPDGTVDVIDGPIFLTGQADDGQHALESCDGFTVLPDGHFLVNEQDGSPVYDEYDAGGHLIPESQGGKRFNLLTLFGFGTSTGVAVSPDGNSLYFITGAGSQQTLIKVNLATKQIEGQQQINSSNIEDIDVVILQ